MKPILLLIFLIAQISSFAKINPYYKEVLQRGYQLIPGDSVEFPDGSKCSVSDFNEGLCGKQWFEKEYCVAKGGQVWDVNACCEGLEPYLEDDTDGQETCQEIDESWFTSKTVTYFFIGVLIPLGLFVFLAFNAKKGLPKK